MHSLVINATRYGCRRNFTIYDVSQGFANGCMSRVWVDIFSDNNFSDIILIDITTTAKILNRDDYKLDNHIMQEYYPITNYYDGGANDNYRVAYYNQYLPRCLKDNQIQLQHKYSIIYRDNSIKDNGIVSFDSLDYLKGFYITNRYLKTYTDIILVQVHDNNQLCDVYINYGLKPDYSLLCEYLIRDIVDIIASYIGCDYYSNFTKNVYENRYIHCETLCKLGSSLCDVCLMDDIPDNLSNMSIRLEIAVDPN